MAQIVEAVPDLGPGSRILDVGSGTGCLIPFFRQRGVQDVLAVDLAPDMLAKVGPPMHDSLPLPHVGPYSCRRVLVERVNASSHVVCRLPEPQ